MILERTINNQNQLVRRTAWCTMTVLRAKKLFTQKMTLETDTGNIDFDPEEHYTNLTYDYAAELESVGLWQMAIFIVLHLENSKHKTTYVKQALLRNIGSVESEEFADFLITKCKLPSHFIHEARALHFTSQNEHAKACYEWILSCDNHKNSNYAFNSLMKNLTISSESHDKKFEDLETVLNKLRLDQEFIEDWHSQGEFLIKFINLKKEVRNYFREFFDEYDNFKDTENVSIQDKAKIGVKSIISLISDQVALIPKFQIEPLSKSAKGLKSEIEKILLEWDTKLKILNHKLDPEVGRVELPHDILIESQNLNSNDKNNALTKISLDILCRNN